MKEKQKRSYDSAWKDIKDIIEELWQRINFSEGQEFLDKELQKIIKTGEVGKRYADKLLDYRGREAALRTSKEPFALVVLTFLEYSNTRGKGKRL